MIQVENKFSINDHNILEKAIPIKITNVINPFMIRILKKKNYEEKLNSISKRLLKIVNQTGMKLNCQEEPKLGDSVIVLPTINNEIKLPAFYCRGIIGPKNLTSSTFNILLVDYGTVVELNINQFMVTDTCFQEEPLSIEVSLYSILPTSSINSNNNKDDFNVFIMKNWTEKSLIFLKQLIDKSDAEYFVYLASDNKDKKYGEIYLVINNNIISLSEALVENLHAVYLKRNYLKIFQSLKADEIYCEKILCTSLNKKTDINWENNNFKHLQLKNVETCNGISKINNITEIENKECSNPCDNNFCKVLIYNAVVYDCITSIADMQFPTAIHYAWNEYIKSPRAKRLQSYILPAIKKGLDTIAIGSYKSGKTTGSIFAVCGSIASFHQVTEQNSPLALILCSSSVEALYAYSLCMEFLKSYSDIKSVLAINGKTDRTISSEICNGCCILISTPPFFMRFLKHNNKFLDLGNLKFLVIDNIDIILEKYRKIILKLMKKMKIIDFNKNTHTYERKLQVILTSNEWIPTLKELMTSIMNDPIICISSFIEALIFKNIRPKLHITPSMKKNDLLLNLINNEKIILKILIVCTSATEAENLNKFLSIYKKTILIHEYINILQLPVMKKQWDKCEVMPYPILICTDDILPQLDLTDINWLIHYSVSLRFKSQFNFRFSTLLNRLKEKEPNCKINIIIDENNDQQFISIIKILQRLGIDLTPKQYKVIEKITVALDRKKRNYSICDNVKSLGFCPNEKSCVYRHHVLAEVDFPTTYIRKGDKVKLIIVYVHNATHFSARILEYIKSGTSNSIKVSEDFIKIQSKIQCHYANINNRKICKSVEVGDTCIFEESVDSFQRVQIMHLKTDSDSENYKYADVRCVDRGNIVKDVNVQSLLEIPTELAQAPVYVMEIFLSGIKPYDDEYSWNYCANDAVYKWFERYFTDNSYIIGTVSLALSNTLWLENLEIGLKLIGYPDVIQTSLKLHLLQKQYAIEYENHIPQIRKLIDVVSVYSNANDNINEMLENIEDCN